jgi:hypothetical protein
MKAKEIVRRDAVVFDTLMEFERTKRIRTKVRLNFTIDRTIASGFKRFCKRNGYNMSSRVEDAIKSLL